MAAALDAGRNTSPYDLTKHGLQPFIEEGANSREQQSECTIFKVGKRERERKPEHFRHEVISLGLYDRANSVSSNPDLGEDKFRLEIVGTLLRELGKNVDDWDEICREVVREPLKIRELYDDVSSDLGEEAVRNVFTLDALFLACCLGTFRSRITFMPGTVFQLFKRKGTKFRDLLFIDILKLENQIPLVLIRSALEFIFVHHETREGDDATVPRTTERNQVEEERGDEVQAGNEIRQGDDVTVQVNAEGNQAEEGRRDEVQTSHKIKKNVSPFLELIYRDFALHHEDSLPFECRRSLLLDWREFPFEELAHLLDLLYRYTRAQLLSHIDLSDSRVNCVAWVMLLVAWAIALKDVLYRTKKILSKRNLLVANERTMPSATKLHEAGIECHGRSFLRHLGGPWMNEKNIVELKVSLFKAKLFLPKTSNVSSEAELLWRSLVAYEDQRHGHAQILMLYFHFMDSLINTQRDVVLLTTGKPPVIDQINLGSEEAVANLYNSLLSNYKLHTFSRFRYDDEYYIQRSLFEKKWAEVTGDIHALCNNKPRQKLMQFKRTYLSKPWLIISILAASALLGLALLGL